LILQRRVSSAALAPLGRLGKSTQGQGQGQGQGTRVWWAGDWHKLDRW
jgi:hypothetical protein